MRVLITGVTGTIGRQVLSLCLDAGHEVTGISRDEQKQREMRISHPNYRSYLADVRDRNAMERFVGPHDVIFHFAALKCIDTLEDNVWEAVQTNIIGTENVVGSSHQHTQVILASTDKACFPVNAYGASKLLAEKLVLKSGDIVCRYGNVLGSRGSFLPKLISEIQADKPIQITHAEATRFFITKEKAAQFVFEAIGQPGRLLIPGMKSVAIMDLVLHLADMLGHEPEFEFIGLRPGEKIHENILPDVSSKDAPRFTKDELTEMLSPFVKGAEG